METLDESNGKAIPFITYNTTLQSKKNLKNK